MYKMAFIVRCSVMISFKFSLYVMNYEIKLEKFFSIVYVKDI